MTLLEQELLEELEIRESQEQQKMNLLNELFAELKSLEKTQSLLIDNQNIFLEKFQNLDNVFTDLKQTLKEQTLTQQEFQNSLEYLETKLTSLENTQTSLLQELMSLKEKL